MIGESSDNHACATVLQCISVNVLITFCQSWVWLTSDSLEQYPSDTPSHKVFGLDRLAGLLMVVNKDLQYHRSVSLDSYQSTFS